MAIAWVELVIEEPQDNQLCWITGGEFNTIVGPFPWKKDANGFLDLWATPEAGALYGKDNGVTHWCSEDQITVPDKDTSDLPIGIGQEAKPDEKAA
jgi:hypothetical protein